MTKLNGIMNYNRTSFMRVALLLLMACFANDMFGQQLYVHYATRDNGKDIIIPSDKRTEAKYFSINGNTIYSYSYPLKNVWKPTYQFSHSNEYYSVYYRVEPSYDEDDRIYLYEDGDKAKLKLTLIDIVRLMTEAACGLDYIHSRGIVHCDIKPHNILVTETGRTDASVQRSRLPLSYQSPELPLFLSFQIRSAHFSEPASTRRIIRYLHQPDII